MAEAAGNTPPEASEGTERKRRFAWVTLSLSAFLMSLTATLINVFYSVQGSEIAVQVPRQVLLYRDGTGENSVLSVAIRLELINTAKDYGDVLLGATLAPRPDGPQFLQEGLAQPVFVADAEAEAGNCELGASCTPLPGLLVIQRSDSIMDMPAGSARALTPYFWLVQHSCEGPARACETYSDFDRVVSELAKAPLAMRLRVKFQNDGEREIVCQGPKIDADYLKEIGWTQVTCTEGKVTGDGLF